MALPRRAAYNPGMGTLAGAEIDGWLRDGGLVVAASDRAARAIRSAFHHRRRAEGLAAWPAPCILDWSGFVRAAWEDRALDGRMLLNPAQEQSLWAGIAGSEKHLATVLEGPRHRLAGMAMRAQELLCSYAPRYLRESARSGWDQDAGAFSGWLAAFDKLCQDSNLLSPARAPLELISLLQKDISQRPPILAAGFDRLMPMHKELFNTWGVWKEVTRADRATDTRFYQAIDEQAELDACAQWCMQRLAADRHARLLVITQDISARRGEMERAFLRFNPTGSAPLFEFSLGVPLGRIAVAHAAILLLRWLDGPLEEKEVDWLISTGLAAAGPIESTSLQAYMRALRRRGLERTQWTLEAFVAPRYASEKLPAAWVQRVMQARRRASDAASESRSPVDWAGLVPQLLEEFGLPGEHRLSSAEFQAFRRLEQAVDSCGSLGFDGRRISWKEFLFILARTLDETLFAPESSDAPIQIAGPAESAGLAADAIWFLGTDEDAWPAAGSTHPLLPPQLQREASMPHATPRLDWELARAISARLMTAAPVVQFSYAGQNKDLETRASRLIVQLAGPPQPLSGEMASTPLPPPRTMRIQDFSSIPFPPHRIQGGSSVLTAQSQCPFKAFATARLDARGWERAEPGLTAAQRGQLLHAVLHAVWGGPPQGIRTHEELRGKPDLEAFVENHVQRVLREKMPAGVRERMPRRYLVVEGLRLTRLVTEWLQYEATRLPFTVNETEVDRTIDIDGLALDLRLDRIDKLNDGSLLVIDYKSGDVSPKAWELPRPDDVQLPLYAGFALNPGEELGGLVFAKVRAGERTFAGRVGAANATLFAGLKGNSTLIKSALTAEQLIDWRDYIGQLARDFLGGRADVDPRDYPRTCERCDLQSLCRIQENQDRLQTEDDSEEAGDE